MTVSTRPRPGFDPLGIRAGSVTVRPFVGAALGYDSNVFSSNSDKQGDFALRSTAGVAASTDWSRHRLFLNGSLADVRYFEQKDERYTDYRVEAGGRYDVTPRSSLGLRAVQSVRHEERGDINSVAGATKPLEYQSSAVYANASTQLNRLTPELELSFEQLDYKDGQRADGTEINRDDRDRDIVSLIGGLNWRFGELRTVFATIGARDVNYTNQQPGALSNDYVNYLTTVGINYDSDGLFAYRAEIGYRINDYTEAGLETVGSYTVRVQGDWNVTSLTTLNLDLNRDLEDAAQEVGETVTRTRATLTVFHELYRNVILTGSGQLRYEEFDARDREDTIYRVGAGARFLVNRNLSLELTSAFDTRESNQANRNYDRAIILVGARFAL